ncbi:tetratricopeptide repeat protein [Campylobacter sp. JMF_02 ED1]|uniref:tetratricopeptide repeat protein n=1 Tax=unclassified Campylobacter TaxID=2593542 RepID=UPI0022E9D59B|nr:MULTISPECIES: tetratricopeptide repeat protein [unclassified Campylobacter]MDA3049393.1 tetratricopeptide repeat protein [Campylobacter sp. JMF_15 NE4]MDA3051179.1 tetratricopeptide repeat protein [Campylobacter sp. JMF_02 ED1]
MNNLLKKLSYLHRAEIQRAIDAFGLDHPATADAYDDIGMSNKKSGNYNNALACFEMALNIRKEILDKPRSGSNIISHIYLASIAHSYIHLAECYTDLGNSEKALEYYDSAIKYGLKALEAQQGNPKKDDLQIANTYDFLGAAYSLTKDFDNAIKYKLKALDLQEMILDKNDRDIIESCFSLAVDYSRIKDNDNVIKYCQKVLQMQNDISDKDNKLSGATYEILAQSYLIANEYSKALQSCEKALNIYESLGDIDSANFIKQLIAEIKQKL